MTTLMINPLTHQNTSLPDIENAAKLTQISTNNPGRSLGKETKRHMRNRNFEAACRSTKKITTNPNYFITRRVYMAS